MSDNLLNLMELRHKLREIYAGHSRVIQAAMKFVLALASAFLLNTKLGAMQTQLLIPATVISALICSVLPWVGMTFFIGVLSIADLHALSTPVMMMFAFILIIIVFTYIVFRPKDSVIIILVPLLYLMKLTFIIPLVVGLACSMFSLVPLGYGVLVTFFLTWAARNTTLLSSNSALTLRQQVTYIITGVINDPRFIILLVCSIFTCVVVYVVRKLPVKYNWEIATSTGAVIWIISTMVLSIMTEVDVSLPYLFLEIVIGIMAAIVLKVFVFAVDYKSTVYTEFEDDDYHYYVKAVPKMDVQPLDHRVKVIASLGEEEDSEEE